MGWELDLVEDEDIEGNRVSVSRLMKVKLLRRLRNMDVGLGVAVWKKMRHPQAMQRLPFLDSPLR
jgi:hypothetical protein